MNANEEMLIEVDQCYPRTIELPEDPELQAKLTRKLEEYEVRKDKVEKPEGHSFSPGYKYAILNRLLKDKVVDRSQIHADLLAMWGEVNENAFDQAFLVVYNYTKGVHQYRGTGLK